MVLSLGIHETKSDSISVRKDLLNKCFFARKPQVHHGKLSKLMIENYENKEFSHF
jgi:hypothetical protein